MPAGTLGFTASGRLTRDEYHDQLMAPIRDNCSAGTAPPLMINVPVFGGCPAGQDPAQWGGHDPHEEPRNTVADRTMKSEFLKPGGAVTDQCAGQPCHSRGWMGAQ